MKFPKLPKFRLPKWNFNFKLPKFFQWKDTSSQKSDRQQSFYYVWKKFMGQIPHESRPTINSYQHFIVFGSVHSGKTELIRGLIEQSQDLYPFDTSYTADPDIQFYLGPNQVIQEISFASLEDKTIKGRRKTIKLWKKLYARREPIVIITYNCLSNEHGNLRDFNRLAQLIAGKISLLSEITKKPLKVRIALTHLDKIPGYLEFARFLKQENLTFEINLSSEFESNTLELCLKKFFEEKVTLMLTSTVNRDFSKMLSFSKEMPTHFHSIEEFLRVLVSRVSFVNSITLDTLSFTSNQESSTSFNPFQWTRLPSMEIYFRYPLLKHQLASAALFLLLITPLMHYFFKERHELALTQIGIDQLKLHDYTGFQEQLIPAYVASTEDNLTGFWSYLIPHYYGEKLDSAKNNLADRIRFSYIDREYRRAVLENKGELKCLFFNGLMYATSNNYLGRFILNNSKRMAPALNLDEKILKAYIISCKQASPQRELYNFSKENPFVPFTSFTPWSDHLNKIQDLCAQQIYVEQNFEEIVRDSDKLMVAVNSIIDDPLPFQIAALLSEEKGIQNTNENIKVIRWIGEYSDVLSNFLGFIRNTSTVPIDIEGMNIRQFFLKIKEISTMRDRENQTYTFGLNGQNYCFHTKEWVDLVVSHNVEKAIQKYSFSNHNSGGDIFFRNTSEVSDYSKGKFIGAFPHFPINVQISGRYTRGEYENKVRSPAEKLAHWVDSLSINPEDKKRFTTFLVNEVMSYVKTYEGCYERFFDSCEIQSISFVNLKQVLRDIAQDSSSFHEFLKMINFETSAFSEPVITLRNMRELNQFEFLNSLLTVDSGEAPYAKYQKLMYTLAQDLEGAPTAGDTEFLSTLEPYLTSLARVSANILQNNQKSYLTRVKNCLNEIGVPDRYQAVFLKPVTQLYKLGLPDLKRCIEHVWSINFQPKIDCVLSKFPFNSDGSEILTMDELNSILNPNSDFYRTMKEVMSTCCMNTQGQWRPLDATDLKLDENLFVKLNQVQKISDLLWDKAGNPQAIELYVQAVPFTISPDDNPVVVESYLVVGDQEIRNANQAPTWKTIKIEWWKPDTCAVGVQLMSKYTNSRSYKSIQKLNCPWSFFELLKGAYADNNNVLTWSVEGDSGKETKYVSLSFQKNPRDILVKN